MYYKSIRYPISCLLYLSFLSQYTILSYISLALSFSLSVGLSLYLSHCHSISLTLYLFHCCYYIRGTMGGVTEVVWNPRGSALALFTRNRFSLWIIQYTICRIIQFSGSGFSFLASTETDLSTLKSTKLFDWHSFLHENNLGDTKEFLDRIRNTS